MVSYYNGNETGEVPGLLPTPYFWWEGGTFFDTLIQYWRLTGDAQYNSLVSQGIQFQQGSNGDFMPSNETHTEGNDDQDIWALAAMSAAESQFPEPQNGTSWVALADTVFNEQAARWDAQTCGGGLRWQIFAFNNGYDYKNTAANGEFFQLASRLARHTGNSTYSDWASKAFNWTTTIGFIDEDWNVYDGASVIQNCSEINKVQFSAYAGTYISGAAYMYNVSSADTTWKSALDGLLNRTLDVFFPDGVLSEIACEAQNSCTTDMKAFKGQLVQSLVDTIQMAPYTAQSILPLLTSSAQAAAKVCNGDFCSEVWNGKTSTNATSGLGEQLSALSVVQGLLVKDAPPESTANSTSTGTSTSSTTKPGSTASGSGAPAAKNAAVVVGAEAAKMAALAAGLAAMTWLL